jgi:hypothetical protein
MLTSTAFSHLWYVWVDLVAGFGLPWDRQTTASLALVIVFYGIGLAFKLLVSREK